MDGRRLRGGGMRMRREDCWGLEGFGSKQFGYNHQSMDFWIVHTFTETWDAYLTNLSFAPSHVWAAA